MAVNASVPDTKRSRQKWNKILLIDLGISKNGRDLTSHSALNFRQLFCLIRNSIDLQWNQLELDPNHFKFSYNWMLGNHSRTKEKQFLNKSKAQVLLHIWGNHYIWWANKREQTIASTAGTAESVFLITRTAYQVCKGSAGLLFTSASELIFSVHGMATFQGQVQS